MAEPQVWSVQQRAWVPADESTPPGTVGSDGSTWTGSGWVKSKNPAAEPAPVSGVASGSTYTPPTGEQIIARRLTGVIYGLIAVLCAVGALSARMVFGANGTGDLVLLGALVAALVFGIMALVKSS